MGRHWKRGLESEMSVSSTSNVEYRMSLQSKWPIRLRKGANDVGTMGRQDIVDGISRRNDALASGCCSATSQPSNHVARLLVVEGLYTL